KPLDTLSLYASFIVWLVVVNAVIIISLVTALTLKTREFEIGVLLSMGVSKLKIVLQFFLELAIVAVVGFTLAVISGSLMAKKVGQTVLNYQVSQSDVNVTDDDSNSWFFEPQSDYFTDVTIDDLTSNYEVSISPIIIGQIYVAGLGIVLIAILIPSLMIMRFNPKRILMSAQ
ncbi:MAG: FtsX-like permease family protein, partial [Erysipelotrichaceae bacterium]|nr:FtsX-like permease family protein [Erysipelotrichaceae bacterium]